MEMDVSGEAEEENSSTPPWQSQVLSNESVYIYTDLHHVPNTKEDDKGKIVLEVAAILKRSDDLIWSNLI